MVRKYTRRQSAVLAAHEQPFQGPSVIDASIISAVRGEYGNYHLTEKAHGSRLWISPLMPLYWLYNAPLVIAQHAALAAVRESISFSAWRSPPTFTQARLPIR